MPQMAPYNWLMLFLFFNIIMIFLITFNHFSNMNEFGGVPISKIKYSYKWTW